MVECEYKTLCDAVNWVYGFNRYMVECECITLIRRLISLSVLIDTWWNVNHQFGIECESHCLF